MSSSPIKFHIKIGKNSILRHLVSNQVDRKRIMLHFIKALRSIFSYGLSKYDKIAFKLMMSVRGGSQNSSKILSNNSRYVRSLTIKYDDFQVLSCSRKYFPCTFVASFHGYCFNSVSLDLTRLKHFDLINPRLIQHLLV